MTDQAHPKRSPGWFRRLLPVGVALGAVLAVVAFLRFGPNGAEAPDAGPIATGPVESVDSTPPDETSTVRSEPTEGAASGVAETARELDRESGADSVAETAPSLAITDAAPDAATAGAAPSLAITDAAPDAATAGAAPSLAITDAAPDAATAETVQDTASADTASTSATVDAAADIAAAAPMIDVDAPDLQGLADLAALTTLPNATDDASLPSIDDPVASDLFGSPVMLISSAAPRIIVLANGTSLVPGAVLPSGHRLIDIERERVLLERDGVEWRLRVPE